MSAPHQTQGSPRLLGWLMRMLDEIDYGVLLVGTAGEVRYMNQAARLKLDDSHPLRLQGERLRARSSADAEALDAGLAGARAGRRKLVNLGQRESSVAMSVVPLESGDGPDGATLLVLGKQSVCETLSVQGYARSLALTPAETRVLMAICDGIGPADLARQQGLALSTIRSQITAIRSKTGTKSIREMVQKVARLPPLVGALRTGLAREEPISGARSIRASPRGVQVSLRSPAVKPAEQPAHQPVASLAPDSAAAST